MQLLDCCKQINPEASAPGRDVLVTRIEAHKSEEGPYWAAPVCQGPGMEPTYAAAHQWSPGSKLPTSPKPSWAPTVLLKHLHAGPMTGKHVAAHFCDMHEHDVCSRTCTLTQGKQMHQCMELPFFCCEVSLPSTFVGLFAAFLGGTEKPALRNEAVRLLPVVVYQASGRDML